MPAGLSSSTLNLKFMQRAAARTPTSAPSTAAPTNSTPSKPDAALTPSTPQPEATDTPTIASEEPYRWKIDRPVPAPRPALLVPALAGPTFESSYMPFMDQDPSSEAGPSRSRNGGGGRMMFGFVEPEHEDVDKDVEGGDNDPTNQEDDDVVINVRDNGKEPKKHGRTQASSMTRGFLRPRSRSPSPHRANGPSTGKASTAKHDATSASTSSSRHKANGARQPVKHMNQMSRPHPEIKQEVDTRPPGRSDPTTSVPAKIRPADIDVKHEPSSRQPSSNHNRQEQEPKNKKKRKQSQAGSSTDASATPNSASQNDKKPRLEPSLLNDYPLQSSQPTSAGRSTPVTAGSAVSSSVSSPTKGGGTLDERENALKAQRQKEKRARKKAKKAAEKAV